MIFAYFILKMVQIIFGLYNNSICSESIVWNRKIRKSLIKALLVNTKNANTFTGPQGQDSLQLISKSLAKNLTIKGSQKKDGTTQAVKPNEIIFALLRSYW